MVSGSLVLCHYPMFLCFISSSPLPPQGGVGEVLLDNMDGVMALFGHAPDAERLGALPVVVPGLA